MKHKIIIGVLLLANAASASTLTRALESNILQAQQIERQEYKRYMNAKSSYQASKAKVKSAKKRLAKAKQDEIKESRQLRAIEKANAEYYQIPQYRYDSGDTGINWRAR